MVNELETSPDQGDESESVPVPPDVGTPQLFSTTATSTMTAQLPRMHVRPREYSGNSSWRQYKGYFEGLPEGQRSTYEQLCLALDQRFGVERLAAVHKATLLGRR